MSVRLEIGEIRSDLLTETAVTLEKQEVSRSVSLPLHLHRTNWGWALCLCRVLSDLHCSEQLKRETYPDAKTDAVELLTVWFTLELEQNIRIKRRTRL